jgi:hypothetical protein
MSEGHGASAERPPVPAALAGATGSAPVPLNQADRAMLALEGPTIAGHTCKVIRLGPTAPSLVALVEANRRTAAASAPPDVPEETTTLLSPT